MIPGHEAAELVARMYERMRSDVSRRALTQTDRLILSVKAIDRGLQEMEAIESACQEVLRHA